MHSCSKLLNEVDYSIGVANMSLTKNLLLGILMCLTVNTSHAISLEVIDSDVTVKIANPSEQAYELLNTITAPASVHGYIGFDKTVGEFNVAFNAPKRSKFYLEWDNKDNVFLDRDTNEMVISHPGQTVYARFNVLRPVTGNLYVYNTEKQLIKTIQFNVKKERSYRQSLNASASDNSYAYKTTDDENVIYVTKENSGSISMGYNITQKVSHSADPYWNAGVHVNTSRQDNDNRSVTISGSYTW